jgi:hypothetical protein
MKPLEEMTPEEIRLEIAWRKKIRNLTDESCELQVNENMPNIHPGGKYTHDATGCWIECSADGTFWITHMGDAWTLLDEVSKLEIGYSIENSLYSMEDNPSVECVIYEPIGGPFSQKWGARENTAPLAICKAWLAWKRSEDK